MVAKLRKLRSRNVGKHEDVVTHEVLNNRRPIFMGVSLYYHFVITMNAFRIARINLAC